MKNKLKIFIMILLLVSIIHCNRDNLSTVELNIIIDNQAKFKFLDKVVAYLTGASALNAQTISYILITVTADDFEPIVKQVTSDSTSVTLNVPAGIDRTFTVAYLENNVKLKGGMKTVCLNAGETISINITLGDLPVIDIYYDQLDFYIFYDNGMLVDYVLLYKSDNGQNWYEIAKIQGNEFTYNSGQNRYEYDISGYYEFQKYYKAVGFNKNGMGSFTTTIYTMY